MKILKFGAEWCSGCIIMKPRWQEIEKEYPGLDTKYYDFDVDKDQIEKYEINDILPVFIFLDKDNKEIVRLDGEVDKAKLIEIINENKEK
jgi:thiol-disulfide isomerase/thioredoxin